MTLFVVSCLIAGQFVHAERAMSNAPACQAIKATVTQQLKTNKATLIVAYCSQEPAL